jgi:hypothetical protein
MLRLRARFGSVRDDVWVKEFEAPAVSNSKMALERAHAHRQKVRRVEFKLGVEVERSDVVHLQAGGSAAGRARRLSRQVRPLDRAPLAGASLDRLANLRVDDAEEVADGAEHYSFSRL